MEKFNIGDWVYASGWCYGCITKIEDGFAVVEYDTCSGRGSCSFMFEDMVKAWPPRKTSKKITIDVYEAIKYLEHEKFHHINDDYAINNDYTEGYNDGLSYCIKKLNKLAESKGE